MKIHPSLRLLSAIAVLLGPVPAATADSLQLKWQITPESEGDPGIWFGPASDGLATRTRGGCLSPTSGNVVVVTEPNTGSRAVRVLSRADGTELRQLNTETAFIGLYQVNMISAAEDGVIYACNLDAPAPTDLRPRMFRILRWDNDESEDPGMIAFGDTDIDPWSADPAGVNDDGETNSPQRWGDSFDAIGSGAGTVLVAGARASSTIALFTTNDGIEFQAHLVPGVGPVGGHHSIALAEKLTGFDDPTTDEVESVDAVVVFSKLNSTPLIRTVIRLDTFTVAGNAATYNGGSNPPNNSGPIGVWPSARLLGAIEFFGTSAADQPDFARLFSYDDPAQFTEAAPGVAFDYSQFNGNFVGSVDFYDPADGNTEILFLNPGNALAIYELTPAPVPPEVTASPPETLSIIEGGFGSLTVGATGSTPLSYQWIRNGTDIPDATGATLALTAMDESKTGEYSCRVTNAVGEALSATCTVSLLPRIDGDLLAPLWTIAPDARPYINTDGTQRSIAWNPALNHLLVFSRSTVPGEPNPFVVALDPATGEEIKDGDARRTLAMTDPDDEFNNVAGGTFALNQIGAGTDGAIYGCNLVTSSDTDLFKIYRWANGQAGTPPAVVFGPENVLGAASAEGRLGDTMAVRGGGATTQILLGARNQARFVILTTTTGTVFEPVHFELPDLPAQSFFQVAFGSDNTIWAKQEAGPVRRISFDLASATATVEEELEPSVVPTAAGAIGASPVRHLLGAVTRENPDSFRLIDTGDTAADPPTVPAAVDQDFFAADNANNNNTGSVAFSNAAVFALSTNNGIAAWSLPELPDPPTPDQPPVLSSVAVAGTPAAPTIRFTLTGTPEASYDVSSATDPAGPWTAVETIVLTEASQELEYPIADGTPRMFFRVAEATAAP